MGTPLENAEFLNEFLVECNENLAKLDNDLVRLEQNPKDLEPLKEIFRAIHTVKGASGMFGLTRLEKVAHAAEDVLNKMREGALEATPAHIDPVLRAIDTIKVLLFDIETNRQEPEGDDSQVIEALHGLLGHHAPPPEDAQTTIAKSAPAADAGSRPQPAEAKSSVAETTLRVRVDVLDQLMNLVGELVLTRNQLVQLVRGVDESLFAAPIQHLNRVTSSLQESVMKTRMQPIGVAWSKLPRVVRDLSQTSGKKLDLVMVGQETEIDRQVLQAIQDPLLHCVRNSADHGIESSEIREKCGKSATGTITLKAFHEGGHIVIEVGDDGAGINAEAVLKKAIERGLVSEDEAASKSEADILRFIFEPGFSTAKQVTEVSGRGVGMDVVRSNIEKIGGVVEILSERGKGTTLKIKIPLTLAIISALIVRVGEGDAADVFALPQSCVLEVLRVNVENAASVETIQNSRFLRLRDSLLPLIDLREVFEGGLAEKSDEFAVVVCQIGPSRFGLIVQEIFDTQEVVVKAPGHYLREVGVYSGATILGDGRVILILDVSKIEELSLSGGASARSQSASSLSERDVAKESERIQLLLFKSSKNSAMGVPLALVSRLEEFAVARIETADGGWFVQHRQSLLPLVATSDNWTPPREGVVPAVIFSDGARTLGLVVSEIQDVAECVLNMQSSRNGKGVLGSAIVEGKVIEIIDVHHYLLQAFPDWFTRKKLENVEQRKPTILLVDDSSFFRELLRPILESQDYVVVTAVDGDDALKAIESREPFDLILSDIEMPGKDGWQLAQELKGRGVLERTPLCALTSRDDASFRARAKELGFQDYLIKFDPDEVLGAIARNLSS